MAGHWVTIDERHVFIGGPGAGAGSASPGGGVGGDKVTKSMPSSKKPAVNLVYHGTSGDVVWDIKNNVLLGFKDYDEVTGNTRPPSVYFTDDLDMAKRYGEGSLRGPSSSYAIVVFEVPKETTKIPDELGSPGDWRISGNVPAAYIKKIVVYSATGEWSHTV